MRQAAAIVLCLTTLPNCAENNNPKRNCAADNNPIFCAKNANVP